MPGCACHSSRHAAAVEHRSAQSGVLAAARDAVTPDAGHVRDRSTAEADRFGSPEMLGFAGSHARRPVLLKGGCLLTMDRQIGSFPIADLLIVGDRIADVGPDISAPDAAVIDARGLIVMPGLIDTHRHCWQGAFRHLAPNATLGCYVSATSKLSRAMRPRDVYIGNLLTCLGAIDSGVTTLLDWSHISNSPEHCEAAIEALFASGLRAIYGYGHSRIGAVTSTYPYDAARLRGHYFSSDDQRVTMCMAADVNRMENWPLARELGLRITAHHFREHDAVALLDAGHRGWLGPDLTLVHCTGGITSDGWKMMRDSGCTVSLAASAIMQLSVGPTGTPPLQAMLDHGLRPSLSIDMETSLPNDFFSQMRLTYALQRAAMHDRIIAGQADAASLMSVEDILHFATIEGARANGQSDRTGTLTPGKKADVIAVDTTDLNTFPLNNAYGTVVLAASPGNVKLVFIDGQLRKCGDRVLGHDLDAIRRQVLESRDYVYERSIALDVVGHGPC